MKRRHKTREGVNWLSASQGYVEGMKHQRRDSLIPRKGRGRSTTGETRVMSKKIKVSEPLTNYRDEPIDVDSGGSVLMADGGFPALVLGVENASRGERQTFRTGKIGIGVYSEENIPVFLFRAIPGGQMDGHSREGTGELRSRAALKIHDFPSGHREAFLESEDRSEGFVSVPVYLVETNPPSEVNVPNVVLGIRDEKLRRHKISEIRSTAKRQFEKYPSARAEMKAAAALMKRRSMEEMMESTTLTTNKGKLMSLAGEGV